MKVGPKHVPLTALVLGLAALYMPSADAQKSGKPRTLAATAIFRCPGPDCPVAAPDAVPVVLTDAIRGDYDSFSFSAPDGAKIDSLGEFALSLAPNGRFLALDFSNGTPSCGAACRRTFTTINITSDNQALVHTNVIDPATGGEASDGLRSIPVGATWRSRLKIAFNTVGSSGETIQWAVRFNPHYYYPSDHVSVTRTSASTWEIFATDAERAMLVSTCCRQKGHTNEGLYAMPFRIQVSTP